MRSSTRTCVHVLCPPGELLANAAQTTEFDVDPKTVSHVSSLSGRRGIDELTALAGCRARWRGRQ
jgi:hypothetical protein